MGAIKEFLRDCDDYLTSFPNVVHRLNPAAKILTTGDTEVHRVNTHVLPCVAPWPLWLRFFSRVEIHCLYGQIPMCIENFKAPLLLAPEGLLIGIHLLL